MRVRTVPTALWLLLFASCQVPARTTADSTRATPVAAQPAPAAPANSFTDRAWIRSDSTGLPGVMRIFLADGTLLMDSCWETYRLERWARGSGNALSWNEDGREIRAAVLSVNDREMTLRLDLAGGAEEQHFTAAAIPYLCPEMRR